VIGRSWRGWSNSTTELEEFDAGAITGDIIDDVEGI